MGSIKIIVSFSGGKDSQACLIYAVNKFGAANVEAIFCDTGWEHPETYKHISETCDVLGVKLTILRADKTFLALAIHKRRFPSAKVRFCTEELKIKPMIDYILSINQSCVIIQGIRADESKARAAMSDECMYFKDYFSKVSGRWVRSYRRKDVITWCAKFDASVSRPFFNESAQTVIDTIIKSGQKPNPLYYKGFSRVGCYPCVMCRLHDIKLITSSPLELERLVEAERCVGSSIFSTDKIPARFYVDPNVPNIRDVATYVKNRTRDISEVTEDSCSSVYHGLCE